MTQTDRFSISHDKAGLHTLVFPEPLAYVFGVWRVPQPLGHGSGHQTTYQ